MTDNSGLLLALMAASFLPAALIFPLPERFELTRRAINLAGAAIKVVLVLVLAAGVFTGNVYEWRATFLPGIDLVLRADPIPVLFVFLSALLWFTTTIYAIGYLARGDHRSRFFGFFSLCVAATVGIALAGNLVTFLIFYELLTVTTYPLVVHQGDEKARAGGRIYLLYTITGGAVLLLGTVWLQAVAGTVTFGDTAVLTGMVASHRTSLIAIFVLLITGLGVKAALVPLHGWLPRAMVAPAPVSALLHAVAVVKAGAYGIVRVIHDLYGAPLAAELGVLTPLAVVAACTIVYGSLRALVQDNIKRRLAFSTISQLSYIVLGASIVSLASVTGALAHLVHQGVMKVTLFYGAGILARNYGIHAVSQMAGAGRRAPVTMTMMTIAALGMVGVPPTVGFVTKWHLGLGAADVGQPWVIAVLVLSSLLNAAYFLPMLARAWFAREQEVPAHPTAAATTAAATPHGMRITGSAVRAKLREADLWLLFPAVLTGTSVLVLGVFAGLPFSPIDWAEDIARVLFQGRP